MPSSVSRLFLLILLLLANLNGSAQQMVMPWFISSWSLSDTSQTHAAERCYDYLKSPSGKLNYKRDVTTLYQYLQNHPDKRLQARTIMYEILGKTEFKYPMVKTDTLNIQKAVEIAHELNDDQLRAEIYALQGQMNLKNDYLLYNLKALELQKKIGFNHFSYVHNRFFSISHALYRTTDFRQSINYGIKCLALKDTEINRWDPRVYIFQLDIIGASYKKLGMNDSTIYFYQKILDTLYSKPDKELRVQRLWTAIAKGNIGYVLAKEHKYELALPLLKEHLEVGIADQLWNNAAMAQNVLSDIWFHKGKYTEAIDGWKKAYKWSLVSETLDNAIAATRGISAAYRITGQTDSAFFYNNLYHIHKDSLNNWLNRQRLSAVSSRISFDNTLNRLEKTSAMLYKERLMRNFILVAIFLLTIIGILFYNRRILKEKIKTEQILRRQKQTELEVQKARESIAQFTTHIVRKDQLINQLQVALVGKAENNTGQDVTEQLLNYTLVTNEEWEKFKFEFAKAYPLFLPTLEAKLPNINPAEERLASLIYLRLHSDQIANMLGIGKESVGRSKRRLKKRLDLATDVDLDDFLTGLQYL